MGNYQEFQHYNDNFEGSVKLLHCDLDWARNPKKTHQELREDWEACMLEWDEENEEE